MNNNVLALVLSFIIGLTSQVTFAIVDNLGDIDDGNVSVGQNTLREAIQHALPGDTITFANSLAGQTITLNNSLIINKDLIIDGTSQNLTLSGGNNTRLFQIDGGSISINNLTLQDSKSADGGAIQVNSGANLSLNDCTIFNNQNTGNSHYGGALFIGNNAKVKINRCLIDNNKSIQGGGIFNQGQLTLNNSTLTRNDANKGGGGLYNETNAEINNSTFSANSAAQPHKGRNLNNAGTLILRNTILANSIEQNKEDCINTGSITEHRNNLIEDNTCSSGATNFISGDPQLGALQDNGGSTKTLALLVGSPAIDAGDNSTCLGTDQRGEPRPIDGSGICDVGAFEAVSDVEPSVVSTVPADNATEVTSTTAVIINFSENVEATVNSFSFECPIGNAVTFNLSTSPATTFTLTPLSDLPFSTECQVQVIANQITDSDTIDPPDNLSGNFSFSFQTASQTLPPPTIPLPPTGLQAVPNSATQTIELSWSDNSNDETGFKITRDGNPLSTTAVDITTYQDNNNLTCNTDYSYSVTAINTAGESTAATATVHTWDCPTLPPTIPSPPTDLQAIPDSATQTIKLSWTDASDDETSFRITRDGNPLSTTDVDTTTYQDNNSLTCHTEYSYSVTAFNTAGESTAATITVSTWDCPTLPPAIPSPPTDLQAVPDSATQTIKLSWSDNSNNETGFKITRDGNLLLNTDVDTTTYQDNNNLNCNTDYSYSVTTVNTAGESTAATATAHTWDCPTSSPPDLPSSTEPTTPPPSSTEPTTSPPSSTEPTTPPPSSTEPTTPPPSSTEPTTPPPSSTKPTTSPPTTTVSNSSGSTNNPTTQTPTAPVELKVVVDSPTEVTLTWRDTSDSETGFKIERNNILIHITAANVTTYKDTELTCNTTYNYTVRATNAAGDSTVLSARITMPTCAITPSVPSDLKIVATSPTQVNLSWIDNSDNETGFKIEREGTVIYVTLANITHYQDSELTCGTNYRYQVTATNTSGDSPVLAQTITTLPCPTTNSSPPETINLGIAFAGNGEGQVKNAADEILCDSSNDDICINYFEVHTPVTLVATAAEGSQFLSWEGDCENTNNSIEFILNTEQNCIAHFDKKASNSSNNANNTSDSTEPQPCQLDKSINCNELPVINHPPTDITLSNQFIDENSLGGTLIGNLTTLDLDVNEVHQYTLLNDANHTFILQNDELYLAQHVQLDFKTIPSYTIEVRSTDSHGAFIEKTFTLEVNNNNESPFSGKVLTADWQVGKNLTIDAPETVNIIGYIKPPDAHIGQIADIKVIYDWTPAQENQTTFNVPITIAHQVPLQADMQMNLYEGRLIGLAGIFKITLGYQLINNDESLTGQIITLTINPNRPPTDIYLSNYTIMENSQPNTVIGWFATTDLDRQDQFTYGLIDNPGNYFTIVGNELRVNQFHFNAINDANYPIKVRSVDLTGAYVEKNFTIEVISTQSKLQDIQLTKNTVLENSPNGFIVGRLWINDNESNHYQYELIEDAQGRFTLKNDLILIANQDELDFENQSSYRITVRGWRTDNTQLILEKSFIIDILNVVDVTVRGKLYDATYQPIDSASHLRSAEEINVELQIIPDQIHRGQAAELLSVALWVANSGKIATYMLNGDTWEEWDGDLATLRSVQTLTLQDHHELTLWQGKLPHLSSGQFYIFGGYHLKNGEIVYSPQPFEVTIQ